MVQRPAGTVLFTALVFTVFFLLVLRHLIYLFLPVI